MIEELCQPLENVESFFFIFWL